MGNTVISGASRLSSPRNSRVGRRGAAFLAAALALFAPGTALATYEATLTLSVADDDLRDRLAAASLVLAHVGEAVS